jgi:outer membrane protein assembly factor BamB
VNNDNAYQPLMDAFPASSPGNCGSSGPEFGAPVYFDGTIYYSASGDVIRAFHMANARLPSQASATSSAAFCYPGAPLSISANGTSEAILWAVENSASQAILHAFDAGSLAELYNSSQAGARDNFGPGSKYTPPTIANGKVFVGSQADTSAGGQNHLAIFGPL